MNILDILKSHNITTVFFDYDNTLVFSRDAYVETYQKIFKEIGIIVEAQRIIELFGKPAFQIIKTIVGSSATDEFIKRLILRREKILLNEKIEKIKLVNGAKEILELLKRGGYTIGIVSSSTKKILDAFSRHLEISQFFDYIISADDVKIGKPDPEPFKIALRKANKKPEECIAIGDTVYDIKSAKDAGILTIGIAWDDETYQKMKKVGADYIVQSLKELLPCH